MIDFAGLRDRLDLMSESFDYENRVKNDPVQFVRRYENVRDREIAGLISAAFAYGNVKIIIKDLEKVFGIIGGSPSDFVENTRDLEELFSGFYHRFNNGGDLALLLWVTAKVAREWGSLENLFLEGYQRCKSPNETEKFSSGLEHFSMTYRKIAADSPVKNTKNFEYLLPLPSGGSPCKRLCMFLRWMARSDSVDPGGWPSIPKSSLIVPVDAHIQRIGKFLGFTSRKNASWKMAVEITESLQGINPEDPLKYDFLLCHMGITGECPETFVGEICQKCAVKEMCLVYNPK